jgi:dTDP-4-dehydrorhamnose reductase
VTLAVFGAGGQVGRALVERAGGAARGFDRAACDICDAAAVARALSAADLSVVVNCAAYTAVDRAEQEPESAFAVNADGAATVAQAAADRNLPMIHLSTDYVYGGTGTAPQRETAPVAPLNVYGASKAAGDAAVARSHPAHLVLRVSWVFGVHGANFVKTMLRLGRDRRELRVVADQRGGPTEARDIADAVLVMAAACRKPGFEAWGTYHFAGAPSTSWHGFAAAVFAQPVCTEAVCAEAVCAETVCTEAACAETACAETACTEAACTPDGAAQDGAAQDGAAQDGAAHRRGAGPALVRIASRDYPTPARRPLNSTLDCTRIRQVFGIDQPDWRRSLARVMAELAAAEP